MAEPPSGNRAELRRQAKTAQRLKMLTLTALSLVLLLAFPLYLGILEVTEDPLQAELNALELPDWATSGEMSEQFLGNRWCIPQCEFGQRSRESSHDVSETHQAYYNALVANGWRQRIGEECPAEEDGIASCWRRDQYVLDMWVRDKWCEERPARPVPGPGAGGTPSPAPPGEGEGDGCGVSLVTVKVYNAVSYKRGPGL